MAKIQTVGKFSEVMGTDWAAPQKNEIVEALKLSGLAMVKSSAGLGAFVPINKAFAAGAATAAVNGCVQSSAAATFVNLHGSVMSMFSWGVVLIIIFSGATWALGHRSKAIEVLIGCCAGYLLAIHAIDIRDFLSCI